jgi:hypothetical protein
MCRRVTTVHYSFWPTVRFYAPTLGSRGVDFSACGVWLTVSFSPVVGIVSIHGMLSIRRNANKDKHLGP